MTTVASVEDRRLLLVLGHVGHPEKLHQHQRVPDILTLSQGPVEFILREVPGAVLVDGLKGLLQVSWITSVRKTAHPKTNKDRSTIIQKRARRALAIPATINTSSWNIFIVRSSRESRPP